MGLNIKIGCTRIVVLTEKLAIKIALPFRPFAPLVIILNELVKGEFGKKLDKYQNNLFRLLVRVVFTGGIDSNRREIRISKEHPEYPIARVLRSYFWGYILVMVRGEALDDSCQLWDCSHSLPLQMQGSDLFYPRNSCRIDDKYYFVDYGDPSAENILQLLFKTECRP